MSYKTWFVFAGLIATTAIGDYYSKCYSVDARWLWLGLAGGAYNLGIGLWIMLLRRMDSLAQAGFVWGLGATIALVLLSQLIFHEPLTARQWCGIVLGFISMMLLL